MEEEGDGLNRSQAQLKVNQSVNKMQQLPHPTNMAQNRVRHVYLEEQNVYGRFEAFLLLKDKLHSQIDSSGTSALVHMCSHNSPYLPLYLSTLKQGDPILNRPTNIGHKPLDVAGIYCKRQYIDLLKEKGAQDNGNVDHWAIQGANIANWSGNVDISKKPLIHWAAYNNLPQVLSKFAQAGANVNQLDANGHSPIDLAMLSKSYESVQVLARLGYRPQDKYLEQSQSPYLKKLFAELEQSNLRKKTIISLKLTFIPLLLLSQFFIVQDVNMYFLIISLLLWIYLVVVTPKEDSNERPTKFFSQIVNREINFNSNHKIYVLFFIVSLLSLLETLIKISADSYLLSVYFLFMLAITIVFAINLCILIYGILTNTTPNEMFASHKNPHLWPKIEYIIHRNMLSRVYKNPNKKDIQSNIQAYLNS